MDSPLCSGVRAVSHPDDIPDAPDYYDYDYDDYGKTTTITNVVALIVGIAIGASCDCGGSAGASENGFSEERFAAYSPG